MATDGFTGFYVETHDYGATAAFWASLGFAAVFETDHGSGEWKHPSGGPYVFIAEQPAGAPLATIPILWVADPTAFPLGLDEPFTPEHWGMVQGFLHDPDGRSVGLQGPLPPGVDAPPPRPHG
jgi:hypothetical protein